MRTAILNGWNGIRLLRLVAGLSITAQGLYTSDWLFAIAGLIFSAMAIFNTGCCAGKHCRGDVKNETATIEGATYEEVM